MADVLGFIKAHPIPIAIGVFGLGALYLLAASNGGGDSSGVAAFAQAQAAQAASGNALAAAQLQATAQTAQVTDYDATQLAINSKWADTQLATTQSNNQTAKDLAPWQTQNNLLAGLVSIAGLPPTTTTTTSTKKGITFGGLLGSVGIGGGTKTNTVVTPNPNAVSAADLLASLGANFFGATPSAGFGGVH